MVVCTVNNAGDSQRHEHFHPVVTFVDEAAKMMEPDAIIPLAWNVTGPVLFVGDHMQLKPTTLTRRPAISKDNCRNPHFQELSDGGEVDAALENLDEDGVEQGRGTVNDPGEV